MTMAKFFVRFSASNANLSLIIIQRGRNGKRKKTKAVASVHRYDEERRGYISAFRNPSSVIARSKHGKKHASLYIKSDPKLVCCLLCYWFFFSS